MLILQRYVRLAKARIRFTAFSVAFVTQLLRGANRLLRDASPEQSDLAKDAVDIFLEMFPIIFPVFRVECRSVAKRGTSEPDGPAIPVECMLSADDVALLIRGLDINPELPKLTAKLEAQAGLVDVVAFESFFLPLLKALIAKLQWSVEQVTRYSSLFRTTLQMFARRFVQIEPQAGNWTTTPRGCGCLDCRQLDQFLINPFQQSISFERSSSERAHLHWMLDRTGIRHVTERQGRETLVVTKPTPPAVVKHEQWQTRFSKAEEQIKKLDQNVLKRLLDVDYEYLTELRAARRGREPLPSTRVPVRRQAPEIVDLT